MRRTTLLLAVLVFVPAPTQCNPLYVLTAPNIMRVGSEENVVVEAHNINADIRVDITLHFFPTGDNIFRKSITLSSNPGYLTIPVTIPRNRIPEETPRYVVLGATSTEFQLERTILISYQMGHIFIQTDKPIYTPTQTVHYRLLTVNNELKPLSETIIVDFMNPQGIILNRDEVPAKSFPGISASIYKIPKIVNNGVWKIAASYKKASQINYTTEFEVKEYVLPSFEVTLKTEKAFFYVDDVKLDVSISARFTYGKPVYGRAFVLFGIMKGEAKISIPSSLQAVAIIDGEGVASLTSEVLKTSFPNIREYLEYSIYITASVITHTGSEMVEAEKSGIKIVTSPYTILFTKTSKYFKPGMPFTLMVLVTNPDGSPANEIPVVVKSGEGYNSRTKADGTARLTINTDGQQEYLQIKVETNAANLLKSQQGSAQMMAEQYKTQDGSRSYLHINIEPAENNLPVQFIIGADKATQSKIDHFTYMLISKGKIVTVGRQERKVDQVMTTTLISITPNLIPSFRLLAYYYVTDGSKTEIVADSLWVDVKDTCMGTLVVSSVREQDKHRIYKPAESFELKITGDSGAAVGLVAVDKAVFVLNKKNKLTQSKIWNVVEKNDIGCTAGSGRDVLGVFSDAGLTFVTNTDIKTATRTEPKCKQPMKRKRRSTSLMDVKATKLSKCKSKMSCTCCLDGMRLNLMGFSCNKRSKRIKLGEECKAAFLDCCNHLQEFKDELSRTELTLARSDGDDNYSIYEEINLRTNFPESWLWTMKILPTNDGGSPVTATVSNVLQDSITTWEIQAISMSLQKGICVAQPFDLVVQKDFFIDLRLPYSVIRNEQVEIRAILYNYGSNQIQVRVEFPYNEKFCSSAKRTQRFRQTVDVPGKGSIAVPYVIVPLIIGEIDIEVKAAVRNVFVADGVRKILRVVPEGKKIHNLQTYELDPKGKNQEININIKVPDVIVPNTKPDSFVRVQGDILAQAIENSIDGAKLKHLIRIPRGCGEQNMASMTPVVIVTNFLDKTRQWERVGIDRRNTALNNIKQGYAQQMTYRKADGSYSIWAHTEPSTWLTAYVVKVFAMSFHLIPIEIDVVCSATKWLIINNQKPDGHFQEDHPVHDKSITGGVAGLENSVSLTAFVLIALREAQFVCSDDLKDNENSIRRASDYLENQIGNMKRAYSVAITTYALSLLNINKLDILMKFASPDQSHWIEDENVNSLYTIEATGYAVLALVQFKKFDQARKAVTWLSQRSEYGGAFSSTQVTMVALQSLAKYQADLPPIKDVDLNVDVNIPARQIPLNWHFNSANKYVSRSEGLKDHEKFTIIASGSGRGTVKVLTTYYVPFTEEVKKCQKFDLRVTVEEVPEASRPQNAENSLMLKIYTRYLGDTDSTMAIVDITMPTGFSPDIKDLNLLNNGVERYISRFELDKALSIKGSLIIYLDSVLHTEDTHFQFKIHQFFKVGLIQPASARIYQFYDTVNSCTKFYNVNKNSTMLSKICRGDVCRCAEGSCVTVKTLASRVSPSVREEKACESETDFVYSVTFHEKERKDNYIYYKMEVVEVIKRGSDEVQNGKMRELITHSNCEGIFDVDFGKGYLIMGQREDLWRIGNRTNYQIGGQTWIEHWPKGDECQDRHYRYLCQDLEEFSEILMVNGCGT
ncbi:complement C3-like [Scyliorhinus canicula]|uniref:complement C3-like n=1 Tax=Scyliorhinus canicula TaxID=7830 RepID=UPI0018F32A5A|nr:complement C3-like [Scyliorhinus canicula]